MPGDTKLHRNLETLMYSVFIPIYEKQKEAREKLEIFVKLGNILQFMYRQWTAISGLAGESSSVVCTWEG